jgi:uncharacterized membrane protein
VAVIEESSAMLNWDDLSLASKRRMYAVLILVLLGVAVLLCEPFLQDFEFARHNQRGSSIVAYIGLGGILSGALLLAILVAIETYQHGGNPFRAVKIAKPDDSPWPLNQGVVWLGINPKITKVQTMAAWILLISVICVFSYCIHAYYRASASTDRGVVGMARLFLYIGGSAFAVLVPTVVAGIIAAKRLRRFRLGTDGERLLLDEGKEAYRSYELNTVRVSSGVLLIGKRWLDLRTPYGQALFDDAALKGYILSRLPADAFLTQRALMREALRRGSAMMLIKLIVFVLMVITSLWVIIWPEQFQSLVDWQVSQLTGLRVEDVARAGKGR